MKINWLITDQSIILNYESQTHILLRTDVWADKIITALKSGKYDDVPAMVSNAKRIEQMSNGKATVKDGEVMIGDVPANSLLSRKIIEFANNGLPYAPLEKFAEKLKKNPSSRAIDQLYAFLEKNNHPITDNGNFIAYKKIRPDYKDIHSGTMNNFPGLIVSMPREEVVNDPNITCSRGLHVANFDYAMNHFGSPTDILVECEVDPADVVSIPIDYGQSKMRVCKYKVLGVIDKELCTPLRKVIDEKSEEPDNQMLCKYCSEPLNEESICLMCQCEICHKPFDIPEDRVCTECKSNI